MPARKSRSKLPPRNRYLMVRSTEGEMAAYELAATVARQTVSDYVRLVVGNHITTNGPAAAAKLLPRG